MSLRGANEVSDVANSASSLDLSLLPHYNARLHHVIASEAKQSPTRCGDCIETKRPRNDMREHYV